MYDLIIIGAGPAGITASVYAARKRMSLLVITKDIGGQAALSGDIENYTGYQFITGPELAAKFEEHMRKFNITLKESEEVLELKKIGDNILVKTNKGSYEAKTAIIASGKRSKEIDVPGEKEFKNKGLTYCATCDAPLFSGKVVAVIGGGNSALDAALQLIKIAKHVYIINITSSLGGDAIMREKVEASKNVTVLNNSQVTAILGDKFVSGIRIKKEGREEQLAVQGIFIEIGLIPNSDFAKEIEKNQFGEIKVNCNNETNIPGVFAAGDVTDVPEKQIIIAAGEGSKAALSAFRYLVQHK
jgi:alkyl hydroperoxide reductase subunit F